jgi:nitrogenase subunit NifH
MLSTYGGAVFHGKVHPVHDAAPDQGTLGRMRRHHRQPDAASQALHQVVVHGHNGVQALVTGPADVGICAAGQVISVELGAG